MHERNRKVSISSAPRSRESRYPVPITLPPSPPTYGVRKTVPACQSVGVATMVVMRAGWSVASSDGFGDAAIRSNASTSRTGELRK